MKITTINSRWTYTIWYIIAKWMWMWHLHLFQHLVGLYIHTHPVHFCLALAFACLFSEWHDRQSRISCRREKPIWVMWCSLALSIRWIEAWALGNAKTFILTMTFAQLYEIQLTDTGHRQRQNDGLILIVCYKYPSIPTSCVLYCC